MSVSKVVGVDLVNVEMAVWQATELGVTVTFPGYLRSPNGLVVADLEGEIPALRKLLDAWNYQDLEIPGEFDNVGVEERVLEVLEGIKMAAESAIANINRYHFKSDEHGRKAYTAYSSCEQDLSGAEPVLLALLNDEECTCVSTPGALCPRCHKGQR